MITQPELSLNGHIVIMSRSLLNTNIQKLVVDLIKAEHGEQADCFSFLFLKAYLEKNTLSQTKAVPDTRYEKHS